MKKNKNKKKYVILTLREDYIAKRKERRDGAREIERRNAKNNSKILSQHVLQNV